MGQVLFVVLMIDFLNIRVELWGCNNDLDEPQQGVEEDGPADN